MSGISNSYVILLKNIWGDGTMSRIEGVILDWAGTAVDFGCFAPVNVFVDIFKNAGIEVTMDEARAPMGMLKIDHIRAMLSMPRVSALWEAKYGRAFDEQDVERLYAEFEPALMASLSEYTDPIPGVIETVEVLKSQGLKIGSTTGYTHDGSRGRQCRQRATARMSISRRMTRIPKEDLILT